MDEKQFDALQTAVQWVVDYQRFRASGEDGQPLMHNQGYWAMGKTGPAYEGELKINEDYDFLGTMKASLVCTSACCLAGDVVLNNGDQMIAFDAESSMQIQSTDWCVDAEGEVHSIPIRAKELLGVTAIEAEYMFNGANSPEDIVRCATQVAAAHGHELVIV